MSAYLVVLFAVTLVVGLVPAAAHASVLTEGFAFGPLAESFTNTITVTFDSNGGSAVDTQLVEAGSLVATPVPDPTKAGNTFAGWYGDAGLSTPWDFAVDTVSIDTTLYGAWAVNNYSVTFESYGGTAVASETVAFGSLVTTPVPDPVRTGYTFAGWYSDALTTTPWDFATDTMGAGDMTLYAKWTVNSYQVTFDSNGGSAVNSQTVAYGSLVTTPSAPTKLGNTFAGWYADAGLNTPWDFAANTVGAGDMTLYAKWDVNNYTVTFDSNGGSAVSSQSVAFGSLVTTPSAPSKLGNTFAGWYSDSGLTTLWNFATNTVGHDVTIYAKWTVNSYNVSFESNGGTPISTQSLDFGSLVATPGPEPTKLGNTFAGWYSDAALTTAWNFSAGTVGAGHMTLYAKWTANSYRVTFVSNGGTAVASRTVAFGSLVATPAPAPTRANYAFLGWYADPGLTIPWHFATDTVGASDMTLYAKWVRLYKITGYAGAHGSLSIGGAAWVRQGSSITVTIKPAAGYGVAAVTVDGVSKGRITSYTFKNVTTTHWISVAFKRITSTALSASASTIRKGSYVKLYTRLYSNTTYFSGVYIRFEVKLPGSTKYILLKKVKLSTTGRATYRYQVLNRGTRYHRVRFLGNAVFLPAPLKPGLALKVR